MAFEVKLEKYDGPLHVLLELIEQNELPITDISLAEVTESYLAHIEQKPVPTEELADFLHIATRLLLIKSRELLPEVEVEQEDVSRLADQLKMYKLFVEASEHVEMYYERPQAWFSREKPMNISKQAPVFTLPPNVSPESLDQAFSGLLKHLQPLFHLQQTSMERVVSVQERLEDLRGAILSRAQMSFRDVIKRSTSKVDIVVSFLALLELVKQRTIHVAQSDVFDDIVIRRVE